MARRVRIFGSNATAEGGILARVDGFYLSIEAQKSGGSLHGHAQLHTQCLHQHTPLTEVLKVLARDKAHLVSDYLRYKSHVCRQVYAGIDAWAQRKQATEDAWPEYKDSVELVSKPAYLSSPDMDSKAWLDLYLKHVQRVQELKNNHVHTIDAKGQRVPLRHYRRADDPRACKWGILQNQVAHRPAVCSLPRLVGDHGDGSIWQT